MINSMVIKDQDKIGTNLTVFTNENDETLIHTVSGSNFYLELHNCWDCKTDYVDIEIDETLDKQSVKFLIDTLQSMYNHMN
jgi:hypothetical protein